MKKIGKRNKEEERPATLQVKRGEAVFGYIILALVCFIALFPLIWIIISSFKPDLLAEPGFSLPKEISLAGYVKVITQLGIWKYFKNSFICATGGVLISMIMLSMSAYVVARYDFKGKNLISACFMATMFIPVSALTFPVYKLINDMGLYNTRTGLILVYACSGIAISFMVIRNYFATIPVELEEAAKIDGCTNTQVFTKIMLPIARPGILTAAVLAWLTLWNEFYWASLLMVDRDRMTIPAILSQFTTSFSTDYNGLFSAIVIIVIPPVLVFAFGSKYFVEALSGGAVKG